MGGAKKREGGAKMIGGGALRMMGKLRKGECANASQLVHVKLMGIKVALSISSFPQEKT